jgi:hypothetical protein
MEAVKEPTTEERRQEYLKSVIIDPKKMQGVWELKIEIHNTQGTKAFGGRLLSTYTHPLTGMRIPLVNLNFQEELGLMIDRPTMRYMPDENPMDRRIIDWLIAHPEVGIEGVELKDGVKSKKQSNPTISLKNVDRQEMSNIDNEDTIDVVIGKLSDDNPKTGISLERLRYLLAHFNLPYFDVRYIKNKTTEKKFLRQKIKSFARGINSDGSLNATKVDDVLNEIDDLKYSYEFKEMLRFAIVKESFGVYKFNNVPIGSNETSAILWMKSNLEIYTEMSGELYPRLKAEGFTFK